MKTQKKFNQFHILYMKVLFITILLCSFSEIAESRCNFWSGGNMLMYQEAVTLYEHSGFKGARFRCADAKVAHVRRIKISSIKVEWGKLIVFDRESFDGARKIFGQGYYENLGVWNDRILSFEIQTGDGQQSFEQKPKEPTYRARENTGSFATRDRNYPQLQRDLGGEWSIILKDPETNEQKRATLELESMTDDKIRYFVTIYVGRYEETGNKWAMGEATFISNFLKIDLRTKKGNAVKGTLKVMNNNYMDGNATMLWGSGGKTLLSLKATK